MTHGEVGKEVAAGERLATRGALLGRVRQGEVEDAPAGALPGHVAALDEKTDRVVCLLYMFSLSKVHC